MLVELSVMEQRYQAVLAVVQDGWRVVEVARRVGVSRQTVHAWIARYEQGGLTALADHLPPPVLVPAPDRCRDRSTDLRAAEGAPGLGSPPDRIPTHAPWR